MYIPFNESAQLLAMQSYCTLAEMRNFIRTAQYQQFSVKAGRQDIRDRLNGLGTTDIFAEDIRFPAGFSVHLDDPQMSTWCTTIRNALDLSERDTEVSDGKRNERSFNDAKRSYEHALQAMNLALKATEINKLAVIGVYTRASFESKFLLNWDVADVGVGG